MPKKIILPEGTGKPLAPYVGGLKIEVQQRCVIE